MKLPFLLTDNLHEHPLAAAPIELAVEDLLPGAEIEFAFRNCYDNLSSHDLSFHVSIGIILTHIMSVLRYGLMRSDLFEPHVVVVMQTGFIIVYENRCGNVHRVAQNEAFFDATFFEAFFYLGGDVNKCPACRYLEP